jgi:hypothetical protein
VRTNKTDLDPDHLLSFPRNPVFLAWLLLFQYNHGLSIDTPAILRPERPVRVVALRLSSLPVSFRAGSLSKVTHPDPRLS